MNLDKLTKVLSELSGYSRQTLISREMFEKNLFSHSHLLADYLWKYYSPKDEPQKTISEDEFIRGSEAIYETITDKDQVLFYLKLFSNGKEMLSQSSFMDFLRCAYSMYKIQYKIKCPDDDDHSADDSPAALSWMEAVFKSAYNIKTEMSIFFLSTWILTNIPRLVNPLHKHITHQLTTSYGHLKGGSKSSSSSVPTNLKTAESSENGHSKGDDDDPTSSLIHPVLMWLLRSSLPGKYLTVLENKPELSTSRQNSVCTTPEQLMEMLGKERPVTETWTLLYDSDDQGLSINRFQHHVFNYRGPTLMFIKADNDYLFCIASDIEWRESCHFWGGEESVLLMVKPEFRVVERGVKLLYSNFSIRGYPFGIQIGKNPRNLSIEIKPEFTYVSYKQIPCKIIRLIAWGCAPPEVKVSQADLRKWEAKQAEKNKKINLNNPEWKDNPDKYLLELAGSYKSYDNQ